MTELRQIWTLVRHQLARRWRSLLAWGISLGALGALYVALYPSMSQLLEDFAKEASGGWQGYLGFGDEISPGEWLNVEFLNALLPIALPFLTMLIGARTVAGDEERKNMDLLLGNPVRRWHLIAASVSTMAIALTVVLVLTWALTYVAAPIADVELSPGNLALAMVGVWALCLAFGTLSLFVSTLVRRAFMATTVSAVILVSMYFLQALAEFSETMRPLRVASLFHHLGSPIEGDFRLLAVLLTVAGALALASASVFTFRRRDIYT